VFGVLIERWGVGGWLSPGVCSVRHIGMCVNLESGFGYQYLIVVVVNISEGFLEGP
jgi:hypothetical protein